MKEEQENFKKKQVLLFKVKHKTIEKIIKQKL